MRDAVELPHDFFKPQQAVSALSSLGFKASFGNMRLKKINSDFLPAIAFLKDGSAVVIKEKLDNDEFLVVASDTRSKNAKIEPELFRQEYSGYLILAKELILQKNKSEVVIGFSAHLKKVNGFTSK